MKKGILFIALISILTFISCDKEDADRPLMTAIISGESFVCTEPVAYLGDSVFTLSGQSTNGLKIEFTVGGANIGGYNMTDTAENKGRYIPNKSLHANRYSSYRKDPNGIVRITDIDTENKKISGTFYFKVWHPTDPIYEYVSDGKFKNIPFTYLPGDENKIGF